MFVESNGFGTEALILLDFPPFLGSFFESEFLLVGNPQEVKDAFFIFFSVKKTPASIK